MIRPALKIFLSVLAGGVLYILTHNLVNIFLPHLPDAPGSHWGYILHQLSHYVMAITVFLLVGFLGVRFFGRTLREKGVFGKYLYISGSAVFLLRRDGTIGYVNRRGCQILNGGRDEILGRKWLEAFIPAPQRRRVRRLFDRAFNRPEAGEIAQGETPIVDLQGKARIVFWRSTAVRDKKGRVTEILCSGEDVTELRRVQQELAENEAKYRTLFNNSRIGIFRTRMSDGLLLECNQYMAEMLGYPDPGAVPRENFYAVHAVSPRKREEILAELRDGKLQNLEVAVRRTDGAVLTALVACWVDPARDMLEGAAVDVTARLAAERSLKEAQRKLSMLIDNLPGLAYRAVRGPGWPMEFISHGCRDLTGYPASALLGNFRDLIVPEDRGRVWGVIESAVRSREPFVVEYRIQPRAGEPRWVWEKGAGVCDDQGVVVAIEGFIQDINDRRCVEEKLQRLNEELETRVKNRTHQLFDTNRELEAFGYSVSHDLRVPLRAIDGFSRILLEDFAQSLGPEGARRLHVIRQNAQHMNELIDSLLTLSRIGTQETRSISLDMETMARECFERLCEESSGGGRASLRLDSLPAAVGDPTMVRLVFQNLIGNALKFSKRNPAAVVEISSQGARGGQNVYSVRDNGVGFDMQYVNRLFEPFQRLHAPEEFEGTGVGLAIVKRIVRRHGGEVWADSKPGQGAVFYFSLPAVLCDNNRSGS